jgi:hypothetical protein
LPSKAEVDPRSCDVAKVPIGDIALGSRTGISVLEDDASLV